MRIRALLLMVAAFVLLYFVAGACFLRFGLEPLLVPHATPSVQTSAPLFQRVSGDSGSAMLVRRYGTPRVGCVIFFPGQHGIISSYERNLFPAFSAQGIAVLAIAYPGQNGAPGKTRLSEILTLAARVASFAQAKCPGHRVVLYGRSFGSMVAAYTARRCHPAGLILESAAPSLSSAIRLRLNSRWYLAPLQLLPVSSLLAHDYSLAGALSRVQDVPAVLFQGTADIETPLEAFRSAGLPSNLRIVVVSGGTHANTYVLARNRLIQSALSMLRQQRN